MKRLVLAVGVLAVSGCASIASGSSQTLTVNTSPEEAQCKFEREGRIIGEIASTPGSVLVQKTKHNIKVACSKHGYQTAEFLNESGSDGATFGNILLGGGIGWAIDSANGADNKYTEIMNITLTK